MLLLLDTLYKLLWHTLSVWSISSLAVAWLYFCDDFLAADPLFQLLTAAHRSPSHDCPQSDPVLRSQRTLFLTLSLMLVVPIA
jgi:hypothetical protein